MQNKSKNIRKKFLKNDLLMYSYIHIAKNLWKDFNDIK